MSEFWKTDEDVDYDLFTLSEFTNGMKYEPPRQRTIKRTHTVNGTKGVNSIYDFDDYAGLDDAEKRKIAERQLISSVGRGYVMQKYRNVNKSENVMSQQVLDQTARDIREVCPMGYSNELIETLYKKPSETNDALPKLSEEFRFSPTSDASNGAVPKKRKGTSSSSASSTSAINDLPPDFIEYDTAPNLKLCDNSEFPAL